MLYTISPKAAPDYMVLDRSRAPNAWRLSSGEPVDLSAEEIILDSPAALWRKVTAWDCIPAFTIDPVVSKKFATVFEAWCAGFMRSYPVKIRSNGIIVDDHSFLTLNIFRTYSAIDPERTEFEQISSAKDPTVMLNVYPKKIVFHSNLSDAPAVFRDKIAPGRLYCTGDFVGCCKKERIAARFDPAVGDYSG